MGLFLLKLDNDYNILSYEQANIEKCNTSDYYNFEHYIKTRGIFFLNKRNTCIIDTSFIFNTRPGSITDYNIYQKLKLILRNKNLNELGI